MSVDQYLRKAKGHLKRGEPEEAAALYKIILEKYPENQAARSGLKMLQQQEAGKTITAASPSQQQMNRLISLYHQGNYQLAISEGLELQKQFSKAAFIPNFLGVVYAALSRFDLAIGSYQRALEINPAHVEAYNNIGVALRDSGKLEEAVINYKSALNIKPDYAEAHNNMGIALYELGKLEDSIASTMKAILYNPDYAEAHSNMGLALHDLGKSNEAVASIRKALKIRPDYAEAYNNLGTVLYDIAKFEEAISSYIKALKLKPDYIQAYNNLGVVLRDTGRTEEAIKTYRHVLKLKPDYADAYHNLGNALQEIGKYDEAVESYKKALAVESGHVLCFTNLCELYEKTNNLEALSNLLEEAAIPSIQEDDNVKYYSAIAAYRSGDYQKSVNIIDSIKQEKISDDRLTQFLANKGKILDAAGYADRAYASFSEMNQEYRKSQLFQSLDPDRYFKQYESYLAELKSNKTPYEGSVNNRDSESHLYFLVGFPRSGTTLLDTILRTHSKIIVCEERQMVAKVVSALGGSEYPKQIESLDSSEVGKLRSIYETELKTYRQAEVADIIIDKFPLNLLHAPIISRIYPESKFILAIRHPLDCILSCFMQSFRLNRAMANMTELERIVEFYCLAMNTFMVSAERYDIDYKMAKYEDLVVDMKKEVTSILAFMDMDWEESLSNYTATAKSRSIIATPSYSQVIKPIYSDSTYRWKKYAKYLQPYYSQLMPWFEMFGYEI